MTAATGLLDRGGERAVTLRAVAREAGIATSSIYPHFPDQPALLLAVVAAAFADLARRLEAAITDDDAPQRLYAAGHAYLDFAAAHPRRYRAMFGSTRPPIDLDALILRLLADLLTDCAAAGHSTSTDPGADTIALWLGLHGLAHQHTVTRTFSWTAQLVPHVVASLAHLTPNRPPQ
ncbi:TetR/AcrR family transcriptional regulator [Streptosporangium sp. NBC_01755]|nr:TetR/AcrR family transcriptional regulator [Streptosporangium sp. NBC_01810]WSA29772.1 TetR/AcrR family transcriptional regulator [Streptosporangium sp. NBC_01810]WSD04092.1 TetR/AcrR family transcriptional regulator [Streptosporangium sp. NBC_01755]